MPIPWRLVIFTAIVVSALLTIKHWSYYFGPAVFETGDYAANALQITGAKHFHEIHGNYSRWGFNHPGPAFFYAYAFSEWLLYDFLGLFHSPHQAHAFAGMMLQSAFFGFAFATVCSFARSQLFTALLALAAMLHFISVPEAFTSIWPPHVLIFPFLAFLVAAASVGSGNLRFLPFLAGSACFLVHGHVAQPLFVVPLTLISLGAYFRLRTPEASNRRQTRLWLGSGAIIICFLIPILLDILKGPQSNFAKILSHIASHAGERNTLQQSIGYLLTYFIYVPRPELVVGSADFSLSIFIRSHIISFGLWATTLVPGAIALWTNKALFLDRRFFRSISAFLLVAILLTIYWGRIQEGELYAFNAFFNYALIFLLFVPSLLFLAYALEGRQLRWPLRFLWLITGVIFFASPAPKGDAELQSAPQLPDQVALAVRNYPATPILLNFAHADWPKGLGVALALQRAHTPFRITAANWRFAYWQAASALSTEAEILAGKGAVWTLTPLEGKREKYGCPLLGNWGLWRPFYTMLTPPSTKIDFARSGNSEDYSILGVSETSASDFVWTTKQRVDVYFSPFHAEKGVILQLDVDPFLGNGRLSGQTVTVSMNNAKLLTAAVREPGVLKVKIPPEIWNATKTAELALYLPQAVSPAALGLSTDPRLLALGIKSITFTSDEVSK